MRVCVCACARMCALANLASNTQAPPRAHTLATTRGRTRAFARAGGALGGACSLPGLPLDAAGPLVEAALDDAGGNAFAIATLPGLCAWVAEQLARNGCGLKVWARVDAGRGIGVRRPRASVVVRRRMRAWVR